MASEATLTILLKAIDQSTAVLQQVEKELGNLSQSHQAAGQSTALMSTIAVAAGIQLQRYAADLERAGVAAVEMAINFHDATITLQNQANISDAAAAQIGDAILQMSRSSLFGASEMVKALAPVAGRLESVTGAALTTAQAQQVLRASTDLASASETSLASSTSALVSVMLAYHVPLSQAADVTDQLFNIARITGVSVDELATSIDRLKDKMGNSAPDVGQMGSLLAELSAQGLSGSRGLLAVSSAMETLTSGSSTVNDELHNLGVGVFDAQGNFIGLRAVIAELSPVFAKLTEAQQNEAAKALFGAGAAGILTNVIKAGAGAFDEYTLRVNEHGTAATATARRQEDLSGQVAILKNNVGATAIAIAEHLTPALTTVVTKINKFDLETVEANRVVKLITTSIDGWGIALDDLKGPIDRLTSLLSDSARGWGIAIGFVLDQIDRIPGIDLSSPANSAQQPNPLYGKPLPYGPSYVNPLYGKPLPFGPSKPTPGEGVVPELSGGGGGGAAAKAISQADQNLLALAAAFDAFNAQTGGTVANFLVALKLGSDKLALDKRLADAETNLNAATMEQANANYQLQLTYAALVEKAISSGETIAQVTAEMFDAIRNKALDAVNGIINAPTREGTQLQLQIDTDQLQADLLTRSGAKTTVGKGETLTAADRQLIAINAQIAALQQEQKIRQDSLAIAKDQAALASNLLRTDQDQQAAIIYLDNAMEHLAGTVQQVDAHIGMVTGASGGSAAPGSADISRMNAVFASGQGAAFLKWIGAPSYDAGTDFVPVTGPALVHRGEQITPAGKSAGTTIHIENHISAPPPGTSDAEMRRFAQFVVEEQQMHLNWARSGGTIPPGGAFGV